MEQFSICTLVKLPFSHALRETRGALAEEEFAVLTEINLHTAGLRMPLAHFDLSDVGLLKGRSPATGENVQLVMKRASEMLANR